MPTYSYNNTASIDYSLNGGKSFSVYDANYTASISGTIVVSTNDLNMALPISGSRSVIFRSYLSGSLLGSSVSNTQFFHAGGTQLKFSSYYTINTHKYMCIVKRGEFNNSLNTSLYDISGSAIETEINFDTANSQSKLDVNNENFTPYATTIGLYDDSLNLVAYAKFANPVKISKDFDSVFIVKFDI